MRYCKYCEKEKEDSDFYESVRTNRCKKCSRKISSLRYYRLRESILEFSREKRAKLLMDIEFPILYVSVYVPSIPVDEQTLEIEDEYCIVFSCGRKLSLQERLFGKKCICCQSGEVRIVKNQILSL